MKKEHAIKKIVEALKQGNLAVFAGAGLSMPTGFVDWKGLLKPLADEIGIDISRETDLISIAQFYFNHKGGNRSRISQEIVDRLGVSRKPTENHTLLAALPISKYWTTNYDNLIEKALEHAGKIADVKHDIGQISTTKTNRDAIVYKMHGDATMSQNAVLIKDDYERYSEDRAPFVTALSGDLVEQTFLFIGFSFADPNIDYILSRVRLHLHGNQREHYAIFKNKARGEHETDEDYSHNKARQDLIIADLKRFNIQAVMVEDYSEITEILRQVTKLLKSPKWFVSSSCSDFSPWGEVLATQFMRTLGKILVDSDIHVHCGLGLGFGNAFLTGALEQVYLADNPRVEKHLTLRPFPQHIDDAGKRQEIWTKYREQMISGCGHAIFLFGNKKSNGETVVANGMMEEFQICIDQGVVPLPIAATESASREIYSLLSTMPEWQAISDETRKCLEKLQEPTENLETLLQPIIGLIQSTER